MRQTFPALLFVVFGLIFIPAGRIFSQTTLDALERDIKKAKNNHEEINKGLASQFATDLAQAVSSPAAALAFFEACGGKVPDPPVELFQHLRKDRDKNERAEITEVYRYEMSLVCLAYCEMLRFAFRSATGQEVADKSVAWPRWVERQTRDYANIHGTFLTHTKVGDGPPVRHYGISGVFRGKKEADWSLGAVPDLYREFVLVRLAAEKSPLTSASWDTYIGAMSVKSGNQGRWETVEEPRLRFQKFTALFEMAPNDIDLTRIVEILQNYPQHPDFNAMHRKAEELLEKLKASKKG